MRIWLGCGGGVFCFLFVFVFCFVVCFFGCDVDVVGYVESNKKIKSVYVYLGIVLYFFINIWLLFIMWWYVCFV